MKSFIYTYERKRNDVNGNPRHWVTVYRIKRNLPILVVNRAECGYLGQTATVIREIVKQKQLPKNAMDSGIGGAKLRGMATITRLN
jgi:hypothetical protein